MKIIHQVHPEDFVKYTTEQIRAKFLLDNLVEPGAVNFVYLLGTPWRQLQ